MNEINPTKDQSMLWGHALEFWDWWGIRLLFAGAGIGALALIVSLTSAYVLYRVADSAQSELQSKTEKLRGDNLALEAQIAPRSLTIDQQSALVLALSSFAGKKVSVWTYSLDPDGAQVAGQILMALKLSNIDLDDKRASFMPMGGFVTGIHVFGPDAKLVAAIRGSLTEATSLKVATESETAKLLSEPSAAATIWIGLKPLPILK